MSLFTAPKGQVLTIQRIETEDEGLNSFLFSLGCYSGEPVTVVSRQRGSCVIAIKEGRYSIDRRLASSIIVC